MLSAGDGFSPRQLASDLELVWSGRVDPWLLWDRHPVGVSLMLALSLLILLWLRRLFRRRLRHAKRHPRFMRAPRPCRQK